MPAEREPRGGRGGGEGQLAQAVGAGDEEGLPADGRATVGAADLERLDLAADATEVIGAQQVALSAFAVSIHQAAWQEHRPHRAEVGVSRVLLRPTARREAILQLERG